MWHKLNGMVLKAAMAAMVFGLLAASSSPAAVAYTAVDWTPQGYNSADLYSTNGIQVAGSGHAPGMFGSHALIWNGAKDNPIDLHPAGFQQSLVKEIGDAGQVGIAFKSGEMFARAIFWKGAAAGAVELTPSGYYYSYGEGICGAQQVGYAFKADQSNRHAFLWSGTAASAINLNPSGFTLSRALAMNGAQQVGFGWGTATGSQNHALLWSGTAASAVDLNPGTLISSQAYGICGTQQVGEGYGTLTGGNSHALLWSGTADSAVDLNPSGISYSKAEDTNGMQQVGSGRGTSTGGKDQAFVWSGTAASAVNLHQFLGAGFTTSIAKDIDSQGNVVGYAVDASNRTHAIIWVPVPEPSTFVLLGMGACGLLAWIWRRGWKAVLFAIPKMCVAFVLFTPAIGFSDTTYTGLTIDVTGPGGLGVKEVQPGPITGEIWATVKGLNLVYTDEKLVELTGGLRISGGGSFLPFDVATNYLPPWTVGSVYPVDLSPDGKTLGHEGLTSKTGTGVLWFRSPVSQVGNEPFKVGTFQANLEAGDSVQFLLSGRSLPMYVFTVDNAVRNGATGYDLNLIHVGEPLVAVPEPSTFVLLGLGVFGLFVWHWRRGRKAGD